MISYQDAVLEVAGMPVLYVPWFAHPDPNSERRSGLLTPDLGISSKIGAFYEQPYLLVISPSEDIVDRADGVHQREPAGEGRLAPALLLRLHRGRRQLHARAGLQLRRRQVRRRHMAQPSLCGRPLRHQQGLAMGLRHRAPDRRPVRPALRHRRRGRAARPRSPASRASCCRRSTPPARSPTSTSRPALSLFQGLRASDDDAEIPKVAPSLFVQKVFDFGAGGQLATDFSAVGLFRDEAADAAGHRPACARHRARHGVGRMGRAIHCRARPRGRAVRLGRGDVYHIDDGGAAGAQDISRFLGVAGAQVSYPMISRQPGMDIIIEPIAMVAYGTPDANDRRLIPNERTRLVFEADETNLFRPSAVTNYDLWEGGARGAVGVNAIARIGSDIELSATRRPPLARGGRPRFQRSQQPLRRGIRLRRLGPRGHWQHLRTSAPASAWTTQLTVKRIDVDAGRQCLALPGRCPLLQGRRERRRAPMTRTKASSGTARFEIDNRWAAVVQQARNITQGEDIRLALGIRYQDECSFFMIAYERSGARDRTLGPSESIGFTFALTGLGGATDPAHPTDFGRYCGCFQQARICADSAGICAGGRPRCAAMFLPSPCRRVGG